MPDFRWLIEAPGLQYLGVRELAGHYFYWTKDHDKALCFKDEPQADLTMMAIRQLAPALFGFEVTLGNAKAVEHGWMGAPESADESLQKFRKNLDKMFGEAAARINAARDEFCG